MLRRLLIPLLLLALLTACATAPRPVRPPAPPLAPGEPPAAGEPPAVAAPVDPTPADTAPADPAVAAEPEPCHGTSHAGGVTVYLEVAGATIRLPVQRCQVTVPAGSITLTLLLQNERANPPVKSTGADHGRWVEDRYLADLQLAPGESRTVTFDLGDLGMTIASPTYTLVGGDPATPFLASAASRQGPWTPVGAGGLVPADHTWLRVTYPRPRPPERFSALAAGWYILPDAGLTGEWEGARVQYVDIAAAPPVLFVNPFVDANGLPTSLHTPAKIYRGAPPELQRVNPADGATQTIYLFSDVPTVLSYEAGAVSYEPEHEFNQAGARRQIDLGTGRVSPAPPRPPFDRAALYRFPSPDGQKVAELVFQGELPTYTVMGTKRSTADLVIREVGSGKTLVHLPKWLTSWGFYSCSNPTPGFAWRPDSQALAALDAPTEDKLVLKLASLAGDSRTVREQIGSGVAYSQYEYNLAWSPGGDQLVAGPDLVEVSTGRVVADKLPGYTFWSPDSRYLLQYQPHHPFTLWGEIGLLTLATGERRDLGHGQGLGWTTAGEALIVRWDVSRQIPPPAKDCP